MAYVTVHSDLEKLIQFLSTRIQWSDECELLNQFIIMQATILDVVEGGHESEYGKQMANWISDVVYYAEEVLEEYLTDESSHIYEYRKQRRHKFLCRSIKMKTQIAERIDDIQKNIEETLIIHRPSHPFLWEVADLQRQRTSDAEEADEVGFRSIFIEEEGIIDVGGITSEAMNRVIEGDLQRAVVPIVGMVGLGKTVLASKVYDDICARMSFELRAWISIYPKSTLKGIMLGILMQFPKVTHTVNEMNEEDLGQVLHDQLKGKKYLIVMDHVSNPLVWEYMEQFFPDDANGSRILFTTRYQNIALRANFDPMNPPLYLRFLNKEESWDLFRSKVSSAGTTSSSQWEEIGRQIVDKCGGLPQAIVYLTDLCFVQGHSSDELSRTADKISTICSDASFCEEMMASSVDELPHYLKQCLYYLSAFPEEYDIPARMLIQLWVAEGFINENHGETVEDTADRYLEMLVDRSLIQVVNRRSDGGVKTCSIHCLVREFLISRVTKSYFLQINKFHEKYPRLVVNAKSAISHEANKLGELRSFLYFNHVVDEQRPWNHRLKCMESLRVLKVLNFGVVPNEVKNMFFLRCLVLDGNSCLQDPSCICNLLNLQILDARSQYIHRMPAGFWKLRKLRYVYFKGPTCLPNPPQLAPSSSSSHDEPSLLKDLQTLSNISASSCTSQVFVKVPNLLKLSVEGDLNALPENLAMLKHLRRLKLTKAFNSLPVNTLPSEFPPNLAKLTLCNAQFKKDPMPLLGRLRNLQILKLLADAYTETQMVCSAGGFPRLQFMEIVSLYNLHELTMEEGTLPNLEHLVVVDCENLLRLNGLGYLTAIRDVDLRNPASQLRQQMEKFQERHQYRLHLHSLVQSQ